VTPIAMHDAHGKQVLPLGLAAGSGCSSFTAAAPLAPETPAPLVVEIHPSTARTPYQRLGVGLAPAAGLLVAIASRPRPREPEGERR
jgi:hypothetical protein